MNAPEKFQLPDIQSTPDARSLAIQQVGVKGLRYPLRLRVAGGGEQATVASVAMTVALPAHLKGTHMSRFVELLERPRPALGVDGLRSLGLEMLAHLGAERGTIELRFPYFMRKAAPVSGIESLLDIDAALLLACEAQDRGRVTLEVVVPVTSLCPCSKKISDYGAHNQRSHLTLSVELRADMSLDELVRIGEDEASCAVFGLLKRPDEKWVTERAYDNPKFVEHLVRDIALRLRADTRIGRWRVASENFESIHNHSAYALIEGAND